MSRLESTIESVLKSHVTCARVCWNSPKSESDWRRPSFDKQEHGQARQDGAHGHATRRANRLQGAVRLAAPETTRALLLDRRYHDSKSCDTSKAARNDKPPLFWGVRRDLALALSVYRVTPALLSERADQRVESRREIRVKIAQAPGEENRLPSLGNPRVRDPRDRLRSAPRRDAFLNPLRDSVSRVERRGFGDVTDQRVAQSIKCGPVWRSAAKRF